MSRAATLLKSEVEEFAREDEDGSYQREEAECRRRQHACQVDGDHQRQAKLPQGAAEQNGLRDVGATARSETGGCGMFPGRSRQLGRQASVVC